MSFDQEYMNPVRKERLRGLRESCGYVENGSSRSVTIGQDDATRSWYASFGIGGGSIWAGSFGELLDKVAKHYQDGHHG